MIPGNCWSCPPSLLGRLGVYGLFISCVGLGLISNAQSNALSRISSTNNVVVMTKGIVEVAPSGTDAWSPAHLNQILNPGDRIRTKEHSLAAVSLNNGSVETLYEISEMQILPTPEVGFFRGLLKMLSRVRNKYDLRAPGFTAAIRGTDFLVRVTDEGVSEVIVLDGEVVLSNSAGSIKLTNYERGIVINGGAPAKTPVLESENDLIQWSLYYPGVLNPDELQFDPQEVEILTNSLGAYRQGDFLQAQAAYPWQTQPITDAGKAYRAAVLLSVGQVEQVTNVLNDIPVSLPSAKALKKLIAAVKFQTLPSSFDVRPSASSEWVAESYYQQSRYHMKGALEAALAAAYAAADKAPRFGFAWERVADLEFSFGRTKKAVAALETSLQLSPRNAQAVSLMGFLLAAENRIPEAISQFDRAIAIDSALGNAWLGRGLSLIRQGYRDEGLRDLLIATSLESQRSLLRSYLGKAFADSGDFKHATRELALAKELNANDPTSWLYSALLKQQQNRINEAIGDLEASEERNDNRSLFRSKLLLDQDRAVRSANLAAIYSDAGMFDVSVREASRAVTADYANYSAHLFLANSYNELRDPALVNLRYETATFSEYLLANLLSPVGGTSLSPYVSQQEYSRLFEGDRVGLSSETDYSSRGSWQQQASQFGWFKDSAYAIDIFYKSANGQRPNNSLEQHAYSVQVKQQLTPHDSVYVQAIWSDYESGDVRQVYDPHAVDPVGRILKVTEEQEPNIFVGYHHEWSPAVHTLFLAGRLDDNFHFAEANADIPGLYQDAMGGIAYNAAQFCGSDAEIWQSLAFQSRFTAYSAELQQIVQLSGHTVIFGGRYQDGHTDTRTEEIHGTGASSCFTSGPDVVSVQASGTELSRLAFYGYEQWQVFDPLWLTAGLSYDHLRYPRNIDSPPVSAEEKTTDRVSPKAGLIWMPGPATTIRGAYTRSLGGLFYDNSVRLEPVQVAGFNQAYRSLIPESVEGTIAGSRFETFDLGLEQRLKTRTYLVLSAEVLKSDANRDAGAFVLDPNNGNSSTSLPSTTQIPERLKYEENSLIASLNQLLGREWAMGARYKVSDARLKTQLPGISTSILSGSDKHALLHNLDLFAIYNHPSGIFGEGQALWAAQSNYSPALHGDEFWQLNLFIGYRFPRRQAQLTIGFLNLTDQDYRIYPLNVYTELPRHRELIASLKFNF